MAKTPWEMAAVGAEFSHQSALFAWAAMAAFAGVNAANDPGCYTIPGEAKKQLEANRILLVESQRPLAELKWLHAIKNQGHGDRVRGNRSKAEGVRAGVFDVMLPVITRFDYGDALATARAFAGAGLELSHGQWAFAGLYLELKKPGKNKTSDEQLDFQAFARDQGYAAEVVVGWEAARDCLLTYLGKSPA